MKNLFRILFVIVFASCDETFPFETGRFPEDFPVNLADLNTEHDEMNSNFVPSTADLSMEFLFSSNSASGGIHFNLEPRRIDFIWSKETGDFSFRILKNYTGSQQTINRLIDINTQNNEKGPYSCSVCGKETDVLLYSSDAGSEKFSVYFDATGASSGTIEGNKIPLRLIGEAGSEMYPCLYGASYVQGAGAQGNGRPEKFLLSSDRDGSFDIYEADLPANVSVLDFMRNKSAKTFRKLDINTPSNDHMPFVNKNMLVFASDRPGGFGGYDLYYSFKTSDGWSEPQNFGPSVNSEFDEFRPVVSDTWEFSNQVMIFSSNRPGGKGGFDLYFIGIPKK